MQIEIDDLLREVCGKPVAYVPNPGNGGDTVIASATYQTLARLGLGYELIHPNRVVPSNRILLYAGGGNLVNMTSFSARFMSRVHATASRLIILPHTIKEVDPLLEAFGPNVDIVCREHASYDYVKASGTRANVYLDHDMAFKLDLDRLLHSSEIRKPTLFKYVFERYIQKYSGPSWTDHLRSQRARKISQKIHASAQSEELFCFRLDGESAMSELPQSNFDLSLLYNFGTENPHTAYFAARSIMTTMQRYKTIHTDRLHIAISGGLLGLDVNFYPNNYYKCRAVYEFSIAKRMPNVKWCEV